MKVESVPVWIYMVYDQRNQELPIYLDYVFGEGTSRDASEGTESEAEDTVEHSSWQEMKILCFQDNWVRARGGLEELEYDLGDTCKWFARIGQIQLPPRRGGNITAPRWMVQPLVENWIAGGAPRETSWRQKSEELCDAVRKALELTFAGRDPRIGYHLGGTKPEVDTIPNILSRLDAGEIVEVCVTATMNFIYREADGSICMGNEADDFQLQIWHENGKHAARVRVEVLGEEAPRPN